MKVGGPIGSRARRKGTFLLLFLAALLLGASTDALAASVDCVAQAGGIIDGFVNYPVPPAQINIDGPCTIRNYTAANPLTSNISWFGSLPSATLLILDNVVMSGNMSCNLAVQGNKIWLVNGTSTTLDPKCLSLLIPVEKIDKANPPGPPFVTIGVPFTWTMTIPVLFDPATGIVINNQGSLNDLHSITVVDDLNATGVDLTYVSHTITWLDTGLPVLPTPSFANVGGVLTFSNFPIVTAGRQFAINLTVVLNNNDPPNSNGTQFINTAHWEFGRFIDNVFYAPLPGENGVTPPLTISAPVLVMTKTGPATMNLGQDGDFALDVQNTGSIDAWDVSLRDLFPDGPTGGMCDIQPQILSAQVFAADGVTPVLGKPALVAGTDYTLTWSGPPTCRLDLVMLTPAARIGPGERLIVRYRTRLDANTQDGVALTNIAGAIQWFNGAGSNPQRVATNKTLTNGTPGVPDFQDAHTVTVALQGFFFDKTVEDRTSGANPATTAAPGDTLRYTLRFRTTNTAQNNFRIFDELDALNAPPAFLAGTLALVTVPAGANTAFTNANGGANGTGVVDIRNLSLPINSTAVIQFDIRLRPALANGKIVSDQAVARLPNNTVIALSDDPNVNGIADPFVAGDEDPTRLTIVSAPAFVIQKISTDLNAGVLLAGDTLRYTLTVKNTGNEDAVNVLLRDAIPVNTTYVAGSTTLNGAAVADVGGTSPLVNGLLIHPPSTATPGSMPADPTGSAPNTATITFDVVISPTVPDGTVISNQGFVSAVTNGVVDQPSDDPRTPIPNDPTRDVVGNNPLLYAIKQVALLVDLGTPGVVDPGDTLRYTITVQNSAAIPATGVVLTDPVPANTTYVLNSTTLNGLAVPDVGGGPPLAAGVNVSSSDRTPPLPGPGAGTISPGFAAVLQYDLTVDNPTPAGTLISNQAVVTSTGQANLLTDGDGNPANGAQPTVVVVGAVQQVAITKTVTVVGGGPALAGATLEYLVSVSNIAAVPALNVVITDDLDASGPGRLAYVPGSATMNGSAAGVSIAGSVITADDGALNGPLAPGGTVTLRFQAILNPGLAVGTVVTNTGVVAWNNPTQTASASVSIVVGSVPGAAVLRGSVWHDADFDDVQDAGERALAGWTASLYRDGVLWSSALTNAAGAYSIIGVEPNDTSGVQYEIRFSAPGAGPNTAMLGTASSSFTNGLQSISNIIAPPGADLQGLNLPIQPNGVVYNSMARTPIAGATLELRTAGGTLLPAGCFPAGAAQQGQVTLADGYYKFDLNFGDPACVSGADYLIAVTPPAGAYVAGYSQIIPPASGPAPPAFSVPACPGTGVDAVPATNTYCEAESSEFAPPVSVAPAAVVYRVLLTLDNSQMPGSSQIFNNHIPLDPQLNGAVSITKTTPLINVSRGQLVPYEITVRNVSGQLLTGMSLVDRVPAGFVYVAGSAVLDGVPAEPAIAGLTLRWDGLTFTGTQSRTVKLLLAVGAGVSEGEYVNRAQVLNGFTNAAITGEATATVRIVPDPTFDCTDVIGKVFDDANRNRAQDDGEAGLPSVRVVTDRGLAATTDAYGRYHITCAIVPHEGRGSNFVLKLDDRTLPSGFRLTTDQVAVRRATRGKALRIDFGASIHRVVAMDLSDAAFEPGSTGIRDQWRPRLDLLVQELRKAPSILRLSYVADTEDAGLVDRRLKAVKKQVTEAWGKPGPYPLTIEPEIFWRRGGPPKQPAVRAPGGG